MKIRVLSGLAILLILLTIPSCSGSLDNSLKLQNIASGDIYLNFRGELITVPAGETVIVKEIPPGTYTYSTTYQIPAGAQSSTVEGAVEGSVSMDAGIKILILYSSTFIDGVYTLYATISSNEDLENSDGVVTP